MEYGVRPARSEKSMHGSSDEGRSVPLSAFFSIPTAGLLAPLSPAFVAAGAFDALDPLMHDSELPESVEAVNLAPFLNLLTDVKNAYVGVVRENQALKRTLSNRRDDALETNRSKSKNSSVGVTPRSIAKQVTVPELPGQVPAPDGAPIDMANPKKEDTTEIPPGAANLTECELSQGTVTQDNERIFAVRETWQRVHDEIAHNTKSPDISVTADGTARRSMSRSSISHRNLLSSTEAHEEVILEQKVRGLCTKIIAYPGSPIRLTWDLVGGLLIMYDLIMIPLKFFEPPESTFVTVMDFFALFYWTANIFATLTCGYVVNGVTVMVPRKIFVHYMKTWFIVDVLVVLPDWIVTFSRGTSKRGGSVKLLRVLRLARVMRLIRLMKLKWILDAINDMLDSELMSIFTNIFKMVLLLIAINHFIATGWYAIAWENKDTDIPTWAKHHGFADASWDYKYITSFHWSITQFTPSSMHVQPQNMTERSYAIGVVIFALIGFSYIVGSITGSLAQIRNMSSEGDQQFYQLRRFLRMNHVPLALSTRIHRYLEFAYTRRKQVMAAKDVKLLTMLSLHLQEELARAMNMPHLKVHPIFRYLEDFSMITMQRLAQTAVTRMTLAREDMLFTPSEKASYMYFVVSGRMFYSKGGCFGQESANPWVDRGEDWIAEPVIWTATWMYLGELTASTESVDLAAIEPTAVFKVVDKVKHVTAVVSQYAVNYLVWLNELLPEELSDIAQGEDMDCVFTDFIPKSTDDEVVTVSSRLLRAYALDMPDYGDVKRKRPVSTPLLP
jgi:hypothetical protein